MVGEVILERFRIERAIGSGGFGTVYRAWDERLQRPVAVKVIDGSDAAPRVMREAQAVARLAHRNIATLYELAGDGQRAFLVSELIEGKPSAPSAAAGSCTTGWSPRSARTPLRRSRTPTETASSIAT